MTLFAPHEPRQDRNQAIVREQGPGSERPGSGWPVCAAVGVAAIFSCWYPIFGLLAVGALLRIAAGRMGWRGVGMSGAFCAVVCVALAVLAGPLAAVGLVITLATGFATVALMHARQASVGKVALVIIAMAACSFAVDTIASIAQGTTLEAVMTGIMMATIKAAVGTGVEAELLLGTASDLVAALWPFPYVVNACFSALAAAAGSSMVATRAGVPAAKIANFDAPGWVIVVLAAAVVGVGASLGGVLGRDVLTASVTVILGLRIIFALQGFGVMSGLLTRFRAGCFIRAAAIFLSVWLETVFFVMSIVGLIDIWANFRKLPRGRAHDEANA